MKYNILIGGSAGQGMDTISALFERILKKSGYYVYTTKDYMSRVRGGHNFTQIRFGDEEISSHYSVLDVIIALDKNTVDSHLDRLQENGILICDESLKSEDSRVLNVPMKKIAIEAGNPKVFGTVAVGTLVQLFGINFNNIDIIFSKKWDEKIIQSNIKAFEKGKIVKSDSHYLRNV